MSRLLALKASRDAQDKKIRAAREEELRLLDVAPPAPAITRLEEVNRMIDITSPAAAAPEVITSADPDQQPIVAPAPAMADRWMEVVKSGDYQFNQHEQALYDVCRRQTGEMSK